MSFTSKKKSRILTAFVVKIDGIIVEQVNEWTFFGGTNNLSLDNHIKIIRNKVNKSIGIICIMLKNIPC